MAALTPIISLSKREPTSPLPPWPSCQVVPPQLPSGAPAGWRSGWRMSLQGGWRGGQGERWLSYLWNPGACVPACHDACKVTIKSQETIRTLWADQRCFLVVACLVTRIQLDSLGNNQIKASGTLFLFFGGGVSSCDFQMFTSIYSGAAP